MCGLTGFWAKTRLEHSSKHILQMMGRQEHRGPNDQGALGICLNRSQVYELNTQEYKIIEEGVNLLFGFNRLSILDTSYNGHQPMTNADRSVSLMMNGEVYNAFEWKSELEAKGYVFKSTTDTEVVLNLYLEYGLEEMLLKLNGMFGIAIADLRTGNLHLARDRFGIKPLYIYEDDQYLAFSSEIKSFLSLPNVTLSLQEENLHEYLLFRNNINDTLFQNISNLKPGTSLSINITDNSRHSNRFYDLDSFHENGIHYTNLDLDVEEMLGRAVQRQMISDVKLGAQLSGGVDSSLVTYFAQQNLSENQLETISITFSDPAFSEEAYVDKVANQLDLKAHKYTLDPSYYLSQIEKATWHFEQPLNHPNSIGLFLLSEKARQHVTVLLSGEGADEVFAGYNRFVQLQSGAWWKRYFLQQAKRYQTNPWHFMKWYTDPEQRMIMATTYGNYNLVNKLWKPFDFNKAIQKRKAIMEQLPTKDNTLRQRQYEMITYLPDLLMRQDKMSMAHSIENRVPFLDNDLVDWGLGLSSSQLLKKRNDRWEGKMPLKTMAAKTFTPDFAFRKKQGFGIPLRNYFANSTFQTNWQDQLLPGIKKRGLFESSSIDQWMKNIDKINNDQIESLWIMVAFETWAQQYLDR